MSSTANNPILSEEEAKKYVIQTIRHGDRDKISKVLNRFRERYRNGKNNIPPRTDFDQVREAEKIFTENT